MVKARLRSNNRILKIVKIEGWLEEVAKIQRAISFVQRRLLGLYRCKAEPGDVVEGYFIRDGILGSDGRGTSKRVKLSY